MAGTAIWYRDPAAAFGRDAAHRFIPLRTMNLTQQLNATFRLALYYSVATTLLTRRTSHMSAALVAAAVTAAVHEASAREGFRLVAAAGGGGGGCVAPTRGNPYMNVTLADLELRPGRPAACDPLAPAVQAAIRAAEAVPETDDPHDFGRSQAPFHTVPSTTVPNDRAAFQHALYGGRQNSAPGSRA